MTFRFTLKSLIIAVFAVLLLWFLWTRIEGLVHGAHITLFTPQNGQAFTEGTTTIKGTTRRATQVFINSSPIPTKPDGSFEATLLIPQGVSILTVDAYDRYDHHAQITRTVYRESAKTSVHRFDTNTPILNHISSE